jgi:hypothetical protein
MISNEPSVFGPLFYKFIALTTLKRVFYQILGGQQAYEYPVG